MPSKKKNKAKEALASTPRQLRWEPDRGQVIGPVPERASEPTPEPEKKPPNPAYDVPGIVPAEPVTEVAQATDYAAGVVAGIIAEVARRRAESLHLYEPLPEQFEFHRSMAPERILVGSNRGGK